LIENGEDDDFDDDALLAELGLENEEEDPIEFAQKLKD